MKIMPSQNYTLPVFIEERFR